MAVWPVLPDYLLCRQQNRMLEGPRRWLGRLGVVGPVGSDGSLEVRLRVRARSDGLHGTRRGEGQP